MISKKEAAEQLKKERELSAYHIPIVSYNGPTAKCGTRVKPKPTLDELDKWSPK